MSTEKIPSKYEIDAMRAYIRRLEARNRTLEAALRASEVKIDELSPVPVETVLRDV
jgi:hypothetical protein